VPRSNESPSSVGNIGMQLVTQSLFTALGAVIALIVAAVLSLILPATYAGPLGVVVAVLAIVVFAITSPCPHCGARNLR
jgi:hypothetical protein